MSNFDDLDNQLSSTFGGKNYNFGTPGGGFVDMEEDDYTEPVEFGAELAHILCSSDLCRGRVGGTKVCLKKNMDCRVVSHQGKVELPEKPCLLVRTGKQFAFVEPSLMTEKLNPRLINDLMGRKGESWGPTFSLIQNGNVSVELQEESLREKCKSAKDCISFRTPARIRGKDAANTYSDTLVALKSDAEEFLGESKRTLEWSDLELDNDEKLVLVQESLEGITKHARFNTMGVAKTATMLRGILNSQETNLETVEASVAGIRGLITIIEGAVGVKGKNYPGSEPSLWGSCHGILERLAKIDSIVSKLGSAIVILREGQSQKRYTTNKAVNFQVKSERSIERRPRIIDGYLYTPTQKEARGTQSKGWEGGFGDMTQNMEMDSQASNSSDLIERNEDSASERANKGGNEDGNNNGGFGGGLVGIIGSGGAGGNGGRGNPSRLDQLEARITRVEKKDAGTGSSNATVFFKNHIFRDRADVSALFQRHLGGDYISCGLFATPHLILNEMHFKLSGSTPDMKAFKALKDLQVKRRDFQAASTAMVHMPTIFDTKKKLESHFYASTTTGNVRFKALPSYSEWGRKTDDDSLACKLTRAMESVDHELQVCIAAEFGMHLDLQVIASAMLSKSVRFVRGLLDYMTECYDSLFEAFGSATETWDLVCFSVEQIFLNEFNTPLSSMVERDFSDPRKLAINVVWTNLRCMSIVDSFNDAGIKNHPSMNGAQIRFVLKQSRSSNNQRLEDKVNAQKTEIATLKQSMEELATKVAAQVNKLRYVEGRSDAACHAAGVATGNGRGGNRGGGGGASG